MKPNHMDQLLLKYSEFLTGTKGRSPNTTRVYMNDLQPFRQFMLNEGLNLWDFNRQSLRKYLAWLATSASKKGVGYARVSMARMLVVLRSFYLFLERNGTINKNPIPKSKTLQIKVEKHLPVFLGLKEVELLLETPDTTTPFGIRDKALLELLYSSGIRLSELANLDISSLEIDSREVKVVGKGSKERIALIGQMTADALKHYLQVGRPNLEQNPVPALFLNRYGFRLSQRSIEKVVSATAKRAGVRPGVHTHTLRHTFATHLLEGGADLRVVQTLLGHASPATTQIYTHVTQSKAKEVYLATHPRAHVPADEEDN
ncbi:tyrosine recombinase [SAR202 cluster bacterium AC-409-J13_OGT_754m]|nr:tyrosine recombinase [SAR202 cluster bacterium AC-409-J13_OGT_754m]